MPKSVSFPIIFVQFKIALGLWNIELKSYLYKQYTLAYGKCTTSCEPLIILNQLWTLNYFKSVEQNILHKNI